MNDDEPDLIVSASATVSFYDAPGGNPYTEAAIRDRLVREIQSQLPEGYGPEFGDYGQFTQWSDMKTLRTVITLEVHL